MKKILIILTLSFVLPGIAQNNKATLHFKDGTELKGLAKITFGDRIKFKKNEKSKNTVYSSKELDFIEFYENKLNSKNGIVGSKHALFYYKNVKYRNSPQLFQIITDGKVKLYIKTRESSTDATDPNGINYIQFADAINFYYVSKEDEAKVTYIGKQGDFTIEGFKENASAYFDDCPTLVKKIENEDDWSNKSDVISAVEFYNNQCHSIIKNKSQEK